MGIRDRLTKVFGNRIPPQMQAGEAAAQMTPASPFSPGEPIGPYDGFSRQPRTQDFVTGYNIAARPRTHERVAFDTLRGLIESYDVAQACIWHRIDSIRALDWSLVPARGFSGDADEAIAQGMAVLEKPDRQTPFANWLAKWLYDVLAYDAGTLYRLRNRGGKVIGLRVVDGTTIAPLLDYWGNVPEMPSEAYVQYAQGLPWNWLTQGDLIYEPFRPRANSPYGVAPLETVLLNANTDLRFQAYFLQRFTEGNIPQAFAAAPETWSPDQIEQFQTYWDAVMLGEQSAKHQIRWMPGGSSIAWSNEKDFSDIFSLFLMRKTCAAYHVVPSDLGFTESVNKSSGETQADVQHRVGDLPLITYIQGVITHFLRHDLGLPVEFKFDTGQEKEDRLALAQAWQIYVESGMASADEGREQLLGLPGDPERPTPRFFSTERLGPVPLLSIQGVAGKVDPETFGPSEDQPVLYQPFVPPPGVVPAPATTDQKASVSAEDAYQTQVRHQLEAENGTPPVRKDGSAAAPVAGAEDAAPGITSQTGITGYDLIGRHGDEEVNEERGELAKGELSAFGRFAKARRRDGKWRDFTFQHLDPAHARRLNQTGRLSVRKAAGQVAVAGLAVRAEDTGRVLMLQRALEDTDPASGCWEFPGGHLEDAETPLQGAWREWSEETGRIPPPGVQTGTWTSVDGIYQGIVWTVPSEDAVPISGDRDHVTNPDDPDGDTVEAIAWWDPDQLPDNPAVRPELLDSIEQVLTALSVPDLEPAVLKAGESNSPKAQGGGDWQGWQHDQSTADYWAPMLTGALAAELTAAQTEQIARDYAATTPPPADDTQDSHKLQETLLAAALLLLALLKPAFSKALTRVLTPLYTDSYLIGLTAAATAIHGTEPQPGKTSPGDTAALDGDGTHSANSLPGTATATLEDTGPQLGNSTSGTTAASNGAKPHPGNPTPGTAAALDGDGTHLGNWMPGDTATAQKLIAQLGAQDGLETLLDTAQDASEPIANTLLNRLAKILATGAANGDPPATTGAALRDAITDPSPAAGIAITEVTRGAGTGALDRYRQQHIAMGRWLIDPASNVCPTCTTNAAAGPVPIGDPYPSGDTSAPAHPRCRCAVTPA